MDHEGVMQGNSFVDLVGWQRTFKWDQRAPREYRVLEFVALKAGADGFEGVGGGVGIPFGMPFSNSISWFSYEILQWCGLHHKKQWPPSFLSNASIAQATAYLLGLLAMIKCAICSCQYDN